LSRLVVNPLDALSLREIHHLHEMQLMGIASAFRLRSASYGGQVAPPIPRAGHIQRKMVRIGLWQIGFSR
jgi:hypothetical protein